MRDVAQIPVPPLFALALARTPGGIPAPVPAARHSDTSRAAARALRASGEAEHQLERYRAAMQAAGPVLWDERTQEHRGGLTDQEAAELLHVQRCAINGRRGSYPWHVYDSGRRRINPHTGKSNAIYVHREHYVKPEDGSGFVVRSSELKPQSPDASASGGVGGGAV